MSFLGTIDIEQVEICIYIYVFMYCSVNVILHVTESPGSVGLELNSKQIHETCSD